MPPSPPPLRRTPKSTFTDFTQANVTSGGGGAGIWGLSKCSAGEYIGFKLTGNVSSLWVNYSVFDKSGHNPSGGKLPIMPPVSSAFPLALPPPVSSAFPLALPPPVSSAFPLALVSSAFPLPAVSSAFPLALPFPCVSIAIPRLLRPCFSLQSVVQLSKDSAFRCGLPVHQVGRNGVDLYAQTGSTGSWVWAGNTAGSLPASATGQSLGGICGPLTALADDNSVKPSTFHGIDSGAASHWRDCHFADALSPSVLKHLLKVEGGAIK